MSEAEVDTANAREEQTKKKKSKYMLLRIAGNFFAVNLGEVREVLGTQQITPLPNMPSYVAGMINLRGKIVTTIDLKLCLKGLGNQSAETHQNKRRCIVITLINSTYFGAIVDDVSEVLSVDASMIETTAGSGEENKLFKGILKLPEGALSPILDLTVALKINDFSNNIKLSA